MSQRSYTIELKSCLCITVISSLILFILTNLFTSNVEYELIQDIGHNFKYGVVVDCGSSGSRAHIFKWDNSESSALSQIEIVKDETSGKPLTKHIMPGVSSFKDEPDKASDYMEPIMEFIASTIPKDRHTDTPVYFLATAGLRLLDNSTQDKIMTDLSTDLRDKFGFPKIKSQVISGEYEGIYSWLSLNMSKKLYNNTQSHGAESSLSYGMIEMGGASTQVAFELTPDIENSIIRNLPNTESIEAFKNEQRTVSLGPSGNVRLFATTFLGLGVNTARDSAIDLLVLDYLRQSDNVADAQKLSTMSPERMTKYEIRLKDPCLTSGSSEIVLRPIELLNNFNNQIMSIGIVIKENEKLFRVRLEGYGDFFECKNLSERLLKLFKKERLNCSQSSRSCPMALLGTNFIPYFNYSFIGLSEMFFTTNEMMNLAGTFNRTSVLHETKRICSSQYNKLLELYSNGGSNAVGFNDRILHECFKATWLLTILHSSGFNMPEDYRDFETLERMAGEEIDWTMGAMVTEVALNKFSNR